MIPVLPETEDLLFPVTLPFDGDLVHISPTPIFLGPVPDYPHDYGDIEEVSGSTTFLDFRAGHPPIARGPRQKTFSFPMLDVEDESCLPEQSEIIHFLAKVHPYVCISRSYWHCYAGINRSSFILSTYLHLYRKMTIKDAIALLRQRRSGYVLSNRLFESKLLEWWG